jgi:hypothetical protein
MKKKSLKNDSKYKSLDSVKLLMSVKVKEE